MMTFIFGIPFSSVFSNFNTLSLQIFPQHVEGDWASDKAMSWEPWMAESGNGQGI